MAETVGRIAVFVKVPARWSSHKFLYTSVVLFLYLMIITKGRWQEVELKSLLERVPNSAMMKTTMMMIWLVTAKITCRFYWWFDKSPSSTFEFIYINIYYICISCVCVYVYLCKRTSLEKLIKTVNEEWPRSSKAGYHAQEMASSTILKQLTTPIIAKHRWLDWTGLTILYITV